MARRLRSETATEEFEPYLESVTRSGERTRTIIYVTLLVLFFIGCGIRDFDWPSWDEQRLHIMLDNFGCVAGTGPASADCDRLLADYANQGLDFAAPAGVNPSDGKSQRDLALHVYERRVIELMKKDLRGYSLEIPLFGVYLDGNDLWLVSGGLMSLLLLILAAHIERELANYEKAAAACLNKTCHDNLVMAQVFVLPGERSGRSAFTRHAFYIVFFTLPVLLNLYVIRSDLSARNYAFNLRMIGPFWVHVEYALRFATVAIVAYLCWRCYRLTIELQTFVVALASRRFPRGVHSGPR
jgi:hypothetical protein